MSDEKEQTKEVETTPVTADVTADGDVKKVEAAKEEESTATFEPVVSVF